MLKSPDSENHVLALGILEAQDPKDIKIPLMLCYKFGKPKQEMWEQHAPKCFAYLNKQGETNPYTGFSFQQIFNMIIDSNTNTEEMMIFFKEYGDYLTRRCVNTDIQKIEITVKLKTKEDDEQQYRDFSESL